MAYSGVNKLWEYQYLSHYPYCVAGTCCICCHVGQLIMRSSIHVAQIPAGLEVNESGSTVSESTNEIMNDRPRQHHSVVGKVM